MIPLLATSLVLVACAEPAPSEDAGPTVEDSGPVEPVSIEQACRDGQMAFPGLGGTQPSSILTYWQRLDHAYYTAVLARRTATPTLAPPEVSAPAGSPRPHVAYCHEAAEHAVIDGLGWIDAASVEVSAYTGQSYWSSSDGTPLTGVEGIYENGWFDSPTQSLPPDDATYLLILRLDTGTHYLHRRTTVIDGVVSGEGTTSGETAPIDAFRAL